MIKNHRTSLTEHRYKTISALTGATILMPAFAAVILSINCIMWRVYLELADFTIDMSYFVYRLMIVVALVWNVFESIIGDLYGFSKFTAGSVLEYVLKLIVAVATAVSASHATAGWSDILGLESISPIILLPLVLLWIMLIVAVAVGCNLLIMIALDLHGWFVYDRAETAKGRDSDSFITFCRNHSKY